VRVLVVGAGGREHAICAALARSPKVEQIWCAPGNGGIESVATCLPELLASDTDGLVRFAKTAPADLTVVGPEAPLVAGIADRFREEGLRIFGPDRRAAELEGSKSFAKEFMLRHDIPTAVHRTFRDFEQARGWCEEASSVPLVVKVDGLAAGKGVRICETRGEAIDACRDAMVARRFGDAGATVVVEEFVRGEEASIHVVLDGHTMLVLPTSQDHKRLGDGDVGPNTGGMGAYSPAPLAEGAMLARVERQVLLPVMHGLRREGLDYRGVLYVGLMITKGGPRVLEFNVRLGDPEAEVILPRITSDLAEIFFAAADAKLADIPDFQIDPRSCVGVVVASAGYPEAYQGGKRITGLAEAEAVPGVAVYHSGTRRRGEDLLTAGGRVLCVTALGEGLRGARDGAYEAVGKIRFEGALYRKDIAARALPAAV
jgi:phosphoribosylamine--glycine ligase